MTDARKLLITRGIRGLVDGLVSVALVTYLTGLGFSPFEVGAIVTGTLLGPANSTNGVVIPKLSAAKTANIAPLNMGEDRQDTRRVYPIHLAQVCAYSGCLT